MAPQTIVRRGQAPAPAITTAFVPPPQCTQGHLTMLERQSFYVWLNEPLPVVATTDGECYPQEFMTSYLAAFRGTTLPAFSPLVCPQNYQTISTQNLGGDSPYIVCCPNAYGFAPPAAPNPDRPGYGGTCYSNIISTTVTKYNNDALSGLIFFSTSGQAYAHPFDGFAYQGHAATTAPISVALRPSQSAIAPSSPTTASAVSSSPQSPAVALSTVSSTVVPLTTISASIVVYSTIPPSIITIYGSNSVGSISSVGATAAAATATTGVSSQVLTGGQIAGVVVGVIAGVILLISALLFLARKRRKQGPASNQDEPAQLDGTNIQRIAQKPKIDEHPSLREKTSEKHVYTATYSPDAIPSTPAPDYHELVSPSDIPQRHELGIDSARASVRGSPDMGRLSPESAPTETGADGRISRSGT